MRVLSLVLLPIAAAAAAAEQMPANPPSAVERLEIPTPPAPQPGREALPTEGSGSSAPAARPVTRENEALFRDFEAWLKQQNLSRAAPKAARPAARADG